MTELAEGKKAPAFKMAASGGREASSAGLKGKPYLLYFYPKADTPGCAKQACAQTATQASGQLRCLQGSRGAKAQSWAPGACEPTVGHPTWH